MKNKNKYYKTTFEVVILSEVPIADELEISQLDYAVTDGDCVLKEYVAFQKELNGKQMADALFEAASEPEFFQLDKDGEEIDT